MSIAGGSVSGALPPSKGAFVLGTLRAGSGLGTPQTVAYGKQDKKNLGKASPVPTLGTGAENKKVMHLGYAQQSRWCAVDKASLCIKYSNTV